MVKKPLSDFINDLVTNKLYKCYFVLITFFFLFLLVIYIHSHVNVTDKLFQVIKVDIHKTFRSLSLQKKILEYISEVPNLPEDDDNSIETIKNAIYMRLKKLGLNYIRVESIVIKSGVEHNDAIVKIDKDSFKVNIIKSISNKKYVIVRYRIPFDVVKFDLINISKSLGTSYKDLIYDIALYEPNSGVIFHSNKAYDSYVNNLILRKIALDRTDKLFNFTNSVYVDKVYVLQNLPVYLLVVFNNSYIALRFIALFLLVIFGVAVLFHHLREAINISSGVIVEEIETLSESLKHFRKRHMFDIDKKNYISLKGSDIKEIDSLISDFSALIDEVITSINEMKDINEFLGNTIEELEQRNEEVKNVHITFSQKLAMIAEGYDETTGNHIVRVGELSAFIAEKLGMDKEFIENIRYYAQLHDIGKILVPREVLTKPGKLTNEEFEQMKKHTLYGAQILNGIERFKMAYNIALYHHEKFNGRGYPFGISGDEIPIEAQIVAVVDVYDALRSERPYKRAMSHEETMEIILKGDGRTSSNDFNPHILDVLLKYEKEISVLYEKVKTKKIGKSILEL